MIFRGMLTHSGASLSKHAMVRATYRDAPYGPYERGLRVVILYPFHKIKLYMSHSHTTNHLRKIFI
jgi:hypothetical protein